MLDITQTWTAALPRLLDMYCRDRDSRDHAIAELLRMADDADEHVAAVETQVMSCGVTDDVNDPFAGWPWLVTA